MTIVVLDAVGIVVGGMKEEQCGIVLLWAI